MRVVAVCEAGWGLCGICSVRWGECLLKLIVCVLAATAATTIWATWWQYVQLCSDHNADPSTLLHHPPINLRPPFSPLLPPPQTPLSQRPLELSHRRQVD